MAGPRNLVTCRSRGRCIGRSAPPAAAGSSGSRGQWDGQWGDEGVERMGGSAVGGEAVGRWCSGGVIGAVMWRAVGGAKWVLGQRGGWHLAGLDGQRRCGAFRADQAGGRVGSGAAAMPVGGRANTGTDRAASAVHPRHRPALGGGHLLVNGVVRPARRRECRPATLRCRRCRVARICAPWPAPPLIRGSAALL
jgi:hypothetical protein